MKKDDRVYLEHIEQALTRIAEYAGEHSKESFLKSHITQDAIIRQLEIIGEATKRISSGLKEQNPDIPWKDMMSMRDKLIHDYIDVDIWVIWDTVLKDVPYLQEKLKELKE